MLDLHDSSLNEAAYFDTTFFIFFIFADVLSACKYHNVFDLPSISL